MIGRLNSMNTWTDAFSLLADVAEQVVGSDAEKKNVARQLHRFQGPLRL